MNIFYLKYILEFTIFMNLTIIAINK